MERRKRLIVQLIGAKKLQFKSQSGQEISGTNLYVAFPDENTEGLQADRFFLKDSIELPKDIRLNDKIDLSFNHKGKIEAVSKVGK